MEPLRSEPLKGRWEHFPHEADIGIRGIGPTREAAFVGAAMALTAVITDPSTVIPTQPLTITCQASDDELLLVDWLNTLVYEMATRKVLFGRFEVHLKDHSLQATVWGESVDVTRHRPAVEVKGATYTELSLKQDERNHWIAQCVVDV